MTELAEIVLSAVPHDPVALACLAGFAPQVVVLDIGLPQLDGSEVARRLREMPAGGPGQRAACHLDALPELHVVPEAA